MNVESTRPAPIKLTPALLRRVEAERTSLASMPAHVCEGLRPVVVVARNGRERPFVGTRYHAEQVGEACRVDGFAVAMIAAEA